MKLFSILPTAILITLLFSCSDLAKIAPLTKQTSALPMQIPVPHHLTTAFSTATSYLDSGENPYSVALHGTTDIRRAISYYMFGAYPDIVYTNLIIYMLPTTEGQTLSTAQSIASGLGGSVTNSLYLLGSDIHIITFATTQSRQSLATMAEQTILSYSTQVMFACPNMFGAFDSSSDDPLVSFAHEGYYPLLKTSAPLAWETNRGTTNGDPVLIAVLDTGIRMEYFEFGGLAGNIQHADHEDFVDENNPTDPSLKSYINLGDPSFGTSRVRTNFAGGIPPENQYIPLESSNSNSLYYVPPPEVMGGVGGHGTAIAGVISAKDNNLGVTGIAPEAKVAPFKIVTSRSNVTTVEAVADALESVSQAITNGHNIRVVSLSVSFTTDNPILFTAILAIAQHPIRPALMVSTDSGNNRNYPRFPGAYNVQIPEVMGISWIDLDDTQQDGTEESEWHWDTTDLFAYSDTQLLANYAEPPSNPYKLWEGTSFATPAVSAAAALVCGADPNIPASGIRLGLNEGARPLVNIGDGSVQFRTLDLAFLNEASQNYGPPENSSTRFVTGPEGELIFVSSTSLEVDTYDGEVWFTEQIPPPTIGTCYIEALEGHSDGSVTALISGVAPPPDPPLWTYYISHRNLSGVWSIPELVYSDWFAHSDRTVVRDFASISDGGIIIFNNKTGGTYSKFYGSVAIPNWGLIEGAQEQVEGSDNPQLIMFMTSDYIYGYSPSTDWDYTPTWTRATDYWEVFSKVGPTAAYGWIDLPKDQLLLNEKVSLRVMKPKIVSGEIVSEGDTTSLSESLFKGFKVAGISLTGNSSGDPYLLLHMLMVDGWGQGYSAPYGGAILEGIRVDWEINTSLESKTGTTKELIYSRDTDYVNEFGASIDNKDDLHVVMRVNSSEREYLLKTLDYN